MNKENKSNLKIIPYIIIGVILGVGIMICLIKYTPLNKLFINNTTITQNGKVIVEKSSLSESVSKTKDSVVVIEGFKAGQMTSTGTGFVYKTDDKYGYVMTNQHVIDETDKIVLVLSNDEEVEGILLGGDEYLDLAVIRMDKKYVISVAQIGDSSSSEVGDTVFTVGSPMGYDYRGTVTSGILSGKDRMVSVSIGDSKTEDYVMRVLQTDAAINPGNSGGPLLNINGEVIGINSMKLVEEEIEGMGFAIPIEYAISHIDSLEKGQSIKWPVLGISMVNISDSSSMYRNNYNIPSSIKTGVLVVGITESTGASNSDLKVGDVIIELNGEKVKNLAYLRYELYKYKPGETIEITYYRDGKERKAKVELTESTSTSPTPSNYKNR
ncbi:MAG: trypsin-like peptidase domain-containing protein [Bacilli bacterium]|nr:trypsin-like peptidase domain-containing protein [Bacilli bacterium]